MRGDRPYYLQVGQAVKKFTPHARGSTFGSRITGSAGSVYPACAGIDPGYHYCQHPMGSLPRMRGDRPSVHKLSSEAFQFTPHARGSTFAVLSLL